MKIFHKNSLKAIAVLLILGFIAPIASAAATPSLGLGLTYGILASTYTNTVAGTTINNGDLGYITAPALAPTVSGTTHVADAAYSQAGIDQGVALANLNSQSCTSLGAGAVNLNAITVGANPPGTFPPGCYSSGGAMNIVLSTIVTLKGAGTYIFRPNGALNTGADAVVQTTDGASACDVFWTPTATTLGANTTFIGTVIDTAGITIGSTVGWLGRALAFGKTISTNTDTITVPTCVNTNTSSSSGKTGTINVVKLVINDNGGTKTVADFPLFVNDKSVVSGQTNTFTADSTYTVNEISNANYTQAFSGDCDSAGHIFMNPSNNKFCIITNNDIGKIAAAPAVPPLIAVVKVPNPLALPAGPGIVNYTYTLRNIGTVPVTDVTMVDDSCKPTSLISGDTNTNNKLDVDETWIYRCGTTLTQTHTNTVVATGWANGISTTDIASATVVVGAATLPPLIHVTKIPNPLALTNSKGGAVTYSEKITNPGVVALSNIRIADDKCSPVEYISGDVNNDLKLDTTETWAYTCKTNLTKTTTNTVIASGEANGLTVKDLAVATVVVPAGTMHSVAPKLPNTGFAPEEENTSWAIFILAVIFMLASASLVVATKKNLI